MAPAIDSLLDDGWFFDEVQVEYVIVEEPA